MHFISQKSPCLVVCVLALSAAGCSGSQGEETATPTLPAVQTAAPTDYPDTTPFPGSGLPPGSDVEPDAVVQISESGFWVLSPPGGPYDAISGELILSETYAGAEEPNCEILYNLTGTVSDAGCSGCEPVVDVLHTSVEVLGACVYPDLAEDGERRSLGFQPSTSEVLLNYKGSGTWLSWYEAQRSADTIEIYWYQEMGVNIDMEQ